MDKVNLREKLALFADHWSPRIVGELNGQQVKLVKFQGEFVWHHHDHEDELFLVVQGRFRMDFQDRAGLVEEGEFLIVPRGIEHRPVAERGSSRFAVRASVHLEHGQYPKRANRSRTAGPLTCRTRR